MQTSIAWLDGGLAVLIWMGSLFILGFVFRHDRGRSERSDH